MAAKTTVGGFQNKIIKQIVDNDWLFGKAKKYNQERDRVRLALLCFLV